VEVCSDFSETESMALKSDLLVDGLSSSALPFSLWPFVISPLSSLKMPFQFHLLFQFWCPFGEKDIQISGSHEA
jgi:hypothetical protein